MRGVSIAIRAFFGSLLLLEERLQLRGHVEIRIEPGGPDSTGGGGGGGRGRAPRPELALTWALHRGPAEVSFSNPKPEIDKAADGKTTTTATFTAPGEYILRAQANDISGDGGGGFQCCWTNAHVKATVK